ncbi:MAG: PqqD family protein [Sphingomonas sp.]
MDTPIPGSTRLKVSPDTIGSDVDGEVVLINIRSGAYIGLDPVGSEVWRRLQNEISFADLCVGLKEHFQGDGDVIESEAGTFVAALAQRGLVLSEA